MMSNEEKNARRRAARAAKKAAATATASVGTSRALPANPFRAHTKRALGFELLVRDEGVTVEQAADAFGWSKPVSYTQLSESAKFAGYRMERQLVGKVSVYRLGEAL